MDYTSILNTTFDSTVSNDGASSPHRDSSTCAPGLPDRSRSLSGGVTSVGMEDNWASLAAAFPAGTTFWSVLFRPVLFFPPDRRSAWFSQWDRRGYRISSLYLFGPFPRTAHPFCCSSSSTLGASFVVHVRCKGFCFYADTAQ